MKAPLFLFNRSTSRLVTLTVIVTTLFASASVVAQETAEQKKSPEAVVQHVQWIAGDWRGEAMGGTFEESWNEPSGKTMVGMFKFMNDDQIVFYEIMTIVPKNESLVLRLKHFDPELVGWEKQDESKEFPLLSFSETSVKFDGLRFEKISEDEMHIFVVIDEGEGAKEEQFVCTRHASAHDRKQAASAMTTHAVEKVLAVDAALSQQRNEISRKVSLADAVQAYVTGLDGLDFKGCPEVFADAFKKHRNAWNASIEFLEQHDELRGEMHELLDKIREKGEDAANQLDAHYKSILDTWTEIEAASK